MGCQPKKLHLRSADLHVVQVHGALGIEDVSTPQTAHLALQGVLNVVQVNCALIRQVVEGVGRLLRCLAPLLVPVAIKNTGQHMSGEMLAVVGAKC